MSLAKKTIAELSQLLVNGEIKSTDIVEDCAKNIDEKESKVNSFVTQTLELAHEQAKESDERFAKKSPLSAIDGIPITLKDVVCTKGVITTASSNILKNFTPPYNATVWEKLKDAGSVLVGKVNTDEFTMGGSTESSAFGVTKNPHDLSRVAGGSSGGSAAAVAANFCLSSIGTDTGGSIRQPAHYCGVTGLKVSYGRISRYGTIPMASSLDTVGPIAKTAEDCAMMLEVIAGKDKRDGTTSHEKVENFREKITQPLKDMTIGIPQEYLNTDGIDTEVLQSFEQGKARLAELGVKFIDITLPNTKYATAVYYIIAPSEISANMSRFDGIRFGNGVKAENLAKIYSETREKGFGDEVKRRILLGTYALSEGYADQYYKKAQQVRTLIKQDFDTAFGKVDAIITPVSPTPAFEIGKNTNDPLQMYLEDIFTIPSSLAGICGVSTPESVSKSGLPIGLQILGKAFEEARVLQIAHQMQQSSE